MEGVTQLGMSWTISTGFKHFECSPLLVEDFQQTFFDNGWCLVGMRPCKSCKKAMEFQDSESLIPSWWFTLTFANAATRSTKCFWTTTTIHLRMVFLVSLHRFQCWGVPPLGLVDQHFVPQLKIKWGDGWCKMRRKLSRLFIAGGCENLMGKLT